FGAMSKMELIKKNVHEKTTGMQIINRLINQGWVQQTTDSKDKRAKLISITEKGLAALAEQMHKIRTATSIVTGNLTYTEKMQLIRLLNKLEDFHLHIYDKNHSPEMLLELALEYKQQNP
ncbi:MAG TPA: winged helix DNA-binding protein, partial [Edaphocola sp.]|nr:winged helix DNA-binding protein [Edaphocola sp.]